MPRQKYDVAQRRAFVVAMHTAGATYDQIAQAAINKFGLENLPKGWDRRYANSDLRRVVQATYSEMREQLLIHRMTQFDRYETLIRTLWPKALKCQQLGIIDRLLKAMRDESALLGIEAPQRVDVRVQQIDQRIERLMEALASGSEGEVAAALGTGSDSEADSIVEGTARYLPVA
jgi:hypothetical protein